MPSNGCDSDQSSSRILLRDSDRLDPPIHVAHVHGMESWLSSLAESAVLIYFLRWRCSHHPGSMVCVLDVDEPFLGGKNILQTSLKREDSRNKNHCRMRYLPFSGSAFQALQPRISVPPALPSAYTTSTYIEFPAERGEDFQLGIFIHWRFRGWHGCKPWILYCYVCPQIWPYMNLQ